MMKDSRFFIIGFCLLVFTSCQWLPEVGSVRLSESSVTLKVGGSKQLTAIVEPAAAEYEGITWTSSDPSVAIVTNGTISARKVGTTTISATAAGVTSNPCQVTVDATHVTGISLSNYSVEIIEGESTTLNATVSPSDATDPSFSWGSDNTSVATVQNGKIVAISPGTANISVRTTDGNKTATCKVTVKSKVIDVTGITLSQSSVYVKEEATVQLKATVKPSNATNQEVSWSSGDDGIATIASDGTVTGVTEGTTTITAKSADGKVTATCKVTVTAEYVEFADANFRQYILDNFDLNRNGKLSLTEAASIKRIEVNTDNIKSLQGIEYMSALSYLRCYGSSSSSGSPLGKLTKLDVSRNTALTYLNCSYNQLTSLDVTKNTALTDLNCGSNQLTSLDVSKNTVLSQLLCDFNQLMSLDMSKNTELKTLWCGSNQLTDLDVSRNTALTSLLCLSNQLTSLDVSKNTELKTLWCGSNQLTSLVTKNTALTDLSCGSNQLTSLDVTKNTALIGLYCGSNQLTSLDVSKNTELKILWCDSNQLTSLDVTKNTALTDLNCGSNQLTSLDVTKNTALTGLYCGSNQLTSLDVSKNTALRSLVCEYNQLTSLDVTKNTALTFLRCSSNQLTTLYMATGQSIEYLSKSSQTQIVRK